MGTNQEPWLNRESIFYIYKIIKEKKLETLLEYGGGSSSYWYIKMLNLNVTTIEHDESWSDLMKEKINFKIWRFNRFIQFVTYFNRY